MKYHTSPSDPSDSSYPLLAALGGLLGAVQYILAQPDEAATLAALDRLRQDATGVMAQTHAAIRSVTERMPYTCSTCGAANKIVNQCGCDPNNLPTPVPPPSPSNPATPTFEELGIMLNAAAFWADGEADEDHPDPLSQVCDLARESNEAFQRLDPAHAHGPELRNALDYLLAQTVDQDLNHGIELSEGEEDARAQSLAVIAKCALPNSEV